MTPEQTSEFASRLKNVEVDGIKHFVYPSVNANIAGVYRRPHVLYWYLDNVRWPGRLKKTCSVPRCVEHYEEIRKVTEPLEDDSWGAGRAYAEKFGVSESYVSRLRRER